MFREYCDDRKKLTYAECELRAIEQKRYYVKSDDDEDDGGSSSTDDVQNSENEHAESVDNGLSPGEDWDSLDRKLTPEEQIAKEKEEILEKAKKNAKDIADIVGPLTEGDTPLGHVEVVKQGGGPSKKPKPNDDGDDAKHPGGDLDLLANQAKHKDIGSWGTQMIRAKDLDTLRLSMKRARDKFIILSKRTLRTKYALEREGAGPGLGPVRVVLREGGVG